MERYLQCLRKEWQRKEGQGAGADTLFFGGGTPGVLTPHDFVRVTEALGIGITWQPREWTVEFSPSTVKREKLTILHELGATRISLGVQSFDECTLVALGRRQTTQQSLRAYELLREFSFSVNLDMMFHIPGQSLSSWMADLRMAVALGPDHISTYCLTGECGTPVGDGLHESWSLSGEKFYRQTWNFLRDKGFEHYEISNFARDGHRCQHNCNTWRMGEWLGLGPSAASQCRGRRFRNVDDLALWAQMEEQGLAAEEDIVFLTKFLLLQDRMIFGLRTADGFDECLLSRAEELGVADCGKLFQRWQEMGFVKKFAGNICPTERGMLVHDTLALEILSQSTFPFVSNT
jgi:oxygen-independent coproporphyrinogen-3 oxidase